MQSHKISVEPTFYTHCIRTYFSGDAGADASPSDPVPDPAEARAEEARSLGARCDARSLTRFSISGGFGERAFRPLPRLSGAAAGGSRFSNLCRSSSMAADLSAFRPLGTILSVIILNIQPGSAIIGSSLYRERTRRIPSPPYHATCTENRSMQRLAAQLDRTTTTQKREQQKEDNNNKN